MRSQNKGFLGIAQWGQNDRAKQKSPRPFVMFWALIIGIVVLLRLTIETSLVGNAFVSVKNTNAYENKHFRRGDLDALDASQNKRNTTLILPSSGSNEIDKLFLNDTTSESNSLRDRPFAKDPGTICSGSTFQRVPSATNLLLPQRRKDGHSCYETSHGNAFFDKSNQNHNHSDTNYVVQVLGGGKCNQNGFERLSHDAARNIIVTAYYEIPSKHPPSKYHEWMKNFLSIYRDPIVIFTSPDMVDLLADLRRRNSNNSNSNETLYFDTVLVALPLEELPLAKLYPKSFWVDQLDRDPQSHIHSPLRGDPRMQGRFESGELYWIWLSKVWFVVETFRIFGVSNAGSIESSWGSSSSEKTSSINNYDEKVFAWIDIGSFRNEDETSHNGDHPPLLLRYPEVVPSTEMLFWSHSSAHSSRTSKSASTKVSTKNYTPLPPKGSPYFDEKSLDGGRYFFHSGAHFAGRPRSIVQFYHQFLHTIDVFVERNLTLADDQAVMQSSCLSAAYENHADDGNDRTDHHDFDKTPYNLCAYATRDMVSGKSKWFGLTKLLQTGWEYQSHNTHIVVNPHDLYWKPPPPEYYFEYSNESTRTMPNCSQRY